MIRESGLPSAWINTTLGAIVSPSRAKVNPENVGDLPYVGLEHIESGTRRLLGHGVASDVRSTKSEFRRGDVLYGKLRPYLKKIWLAEFDGVCSTDIIVYSQSDDLDSGYLAYLLSTQEATDHAVASSSGINLPRVSVAALGALRVALPPLAEQRRIVAKLDELLARSRSARAALDAVPGLVERYTRSVLATAFRGDLTVGYRGTGASDAPTTVAEEPPLALETFEHYALPETWRWRYIGDVCRVVRGASPRPAGDPRYFNGLDTPWITVGEITRDSSMFLDSTETRLTEAGKANSRYIEPNTLLLTNSGATLGVPKITRIAGCINDGSVALLGLDEVDRAFLYYYLSAQTDRLRALNQGAAQPNLNTSIVRSIPVPWPPRGERAAISLRLGRLLSNVEPRTRSIRDAGEMLGQLDSSILRSAFSGRLIRPNSS